MKNFRKLFLILIIFSLSIAGLGASGSREEAETAAESAAGAKDAAGAEEKEAKAKAEGAAAEESASGEAPLKERRAAERGPDGILSDPGTPPVTFYKDFRTDFGRSAVYFDSIIPGGAPRDGIPAL